MLAAAIFALGLATGAVLGPSVAGHLGAAITAVPASAAVPTPAEARGIRAALPAQVLRVIDGDTFEARVNVWPGVDITTKVRLRGIDAAELRARCAEERAKAEGARDALAAILAEGEVGISLITHDKYGGRVLANASTRKTADVSAALLQAGLVRAYAGGKRETWCG